jgi:rhodanese-related sulfurtransferase
VWLSQTFKPPLKLRYHNTNQSIQFIPTLKRSSTETCNILFPLSTLFSDIEHEKSSPNPYSPLPYPPHLHLHFYLYFLSPLPPPKKDQILSTPTSTTIRSSPPISRSCPPASTQLFTVSKPATATAAAAQNPLLHESPSRDTQRLQDIRLRIHKRHHQLIISLEDPNRYISPFPPPLPQNPSILTTKTPDVREPHELQASGTIPTAVNLPLQSAPDALLLSAEDFETRFGFEKPGLDATVIFYCKSGVRSRAAAEIARRAGYGVAEDGKDNAEVAEYPGSWIDWEKNGGRVESVEK